MAMDTAAPRPRRWVAAVVAAVVLIAGVTVLFVTRPSGGPVATTRVVVFVEPRSSASVRSFLDTLDVVGEVTF